MYKFQGNWSDGAINNGGTTLYVVNSNYSRVERYTITTGPFALTLVSDWGGFGIADGKLKQPQGVTVDTTGNVYVVDSGNNRIQKFTDAGVWVATWGTAGSGDLQFNNPTGISTDDTYLYIADTGNNRVQKITVGGVFTAKWGTLGSGTSQFSNPKGIAKYSYGGNTYIYVADTGNNRIMRFNIDGTPTDLYPSWGTYGTATNGKFNQPQRLAQDSDGYLYVTDATGRVQKFDQQGVFQLVFSPTCGESGISAVSSITTNGNTVYALIPYTQISKYSTSGILDSYVVSEIQQPIDIALDSSRNFYFNNNHTQTIHKFNSSFTPLAEWPGPTPFSNPMGIGVNTGGDVCVADTGNNQLQRFDTIGTWQLNITPIPTIGAFSGQKDVANEATGKMYVADTGNNRILKFNPDGTFIWALGAPTPTPESTPGPGTPTPTPPAGSFNNPYGITVDPYNNIYIADTSYHRIQKYNANGDYQSMWGEYGSADGKAQPQLDSPQGMSIDTSNNIYVADTGNNRIQRFDSLGANQVCWGEYGTGDGQFNVPRNIAVDTVNRIYVSDTTNKRIQIFGPTTFASVSISQTNGTYITEGSTIDSYSVKLTTQPSSTVTVSVTPDIQSTATISALLFTPYNWNIAQDVTVTAENDFIQEGDHTSTITHTVSSSDATYNGISVGSVISNITDNDTAGVTLTESSGATAINESGTTDTYTVVLNTKPTANVTITLSPDTQSSVSPSTLTFTTTNWNSSQTVTVAAIHDFIAEGAHSSVITHTVASSDTNYNALAVSSITASVTDSDTAGVTISKSNIDLNESGSSTYTVVLTSKPIASVFFDATGSAELTVSPTLLTFSDTTWNVPQTITVSVLHDNIDNAVNPRTVQITHGVRSTDTNFDAISATATDIDITDIDSAGILLTETSATTAVTETLTGTSTDTYTITLTSTPSATVVINLTSTLEATTAASQYTFTPPIWNIPQTVTVKAINDNIAQGDHTASITHTVTSTDTNYNGQAPILTVTITDMNEVGIVPTAPNGAVNIVEAGPDDLYHVRLSSKPSADVTVAISGGTQSTITPSTLTFTSLNWGDDQIATVSAVQDYMVEGPHTATITHTATSSDTDYNGEISSMTINITDDDNTVPGVAVVQTGDGTSVTEAGNTDTYTLVLTSIPTANVKIKVLGNNWEATTSASVYYFTASNWSTPQTISIRANDDTTIDGGKTTIFTHTATSTDLHYNAIAIDSVTVNVNDNDFSAPASAPTCGKTPPYDTPNLFQINTTQNTATLYYTPIKNDISYYYIAYGYQPGDLRFGVSYEFGSYDGVIDYTINALATGTRYYFQVRGGNGCATGKWSNSLGATTVASGSASTSITYAPAQQTYSSSSTTGGSSASVQFTRNLYPGSRGSDVFALQQFLNVNGYTVASSGPGSPGNETDFYGSLTTAAVRRFQEAHFAQILSPLGYSSGTGILGPSTRAYINSGGK